MLTYKIYLPLAVVFLATFAWAVSGAQNPQTTPAPKQPHQELLRWVSLSTDSRDTVREIIRSEVDNREYFSTRQEEKTNFKAVEDEKEREDSDYKNAIISANREFVRSKKRRDDVTSQFQMSSAVPEAKPIPAVQPPQVIAKAIPHFKRTYRPLAVKDAPGCLFELRSANISKEGIRILS